VRPGGAAQSAYRNAEAAQVEHCPRCRATLAIQPLGDVDGLGCSACGGIFLPRGLVTELMEGHDAGRRLRLAFPRGRGDAPESDSEVRYLRCPACDNVMNREIFGHISGVIVDACRSHGVWFDAGELDAILTFVEEGGIERMRARKTALAEEALRAARTAARVVATQPRESFHRGMLVREHPAALWLLDDLLRMVL
jgi:Zn-finger nucleic acid-binding protein